jgi:hypothetical protein
MTVVPMTPARWHAPSLPAMMPVDRVAGALGWFSLVLGLAEVFAPRRLAGVIGTGRPQVVRSYGLRELVAGIGILSGRGTRFWLWGRVVGDALDIATLACALRRDNPRRGAAMTALGSVVFVTLLDIYCAQVYGESPEDHSWRH